jgi:class 3 adenylate cyclase
LSLLESRPFDLILLDIMMPEMDGFQVLEHLKKDMQLRNVPVIMISALDDLESVVKCIELGAEDYLPKPFNPTLLKARIGASLEKKRLRDLEASYLKRIKEEQRRSDDLLNVILPVAAVRELKATGEVKPRRHEGVAILFCDIVGFTSFCDQHLPERVVSHLQGLVDVFEEIVRDHQMEKIKTIGDAFMATAGLLHPVDTPLLTAVRCGLDMAVAAARVEPKWDVRTGVHFGPVVAGIVGHQQFLFDVWGDTVNVAARLVEHSSPGSISMTHAAWQEIQDECLARSVGLVEIKGKGPIEVIECFSLR